METQPVPSLLLAPGSNADGSQEGDPGDWQPPQVDEAGFAVDGDGLPINLRRRALVLADQGKDEDPGGHVSPDAIAQASETLADYDERFPKLSGMSKANMLALDEVERLAIPEDAKADDIRATIQAARPARI
jgi:hypothetical protein